MPVRTQSARIQIVRARTDRARTARASRLAARSGGFTLIELMIGITIGLLVTLAAVGSLQFVSATNKTVSSNTQLEQQTNTALSMIGDQIRQAGAVNIVLADAAVQDGRVVYEGAYSGVTGIATKGGRQVAVTGTDNSLTVSYSPATVGPASANCVGGAAVAFPAGGGVTPTNQIVNVYSLSADASVAGDSLLQCNDGSATTATILQGVRELSVRYLRYVRAKLPADDRIAFLTAAQVSGEDQTTLGWGTIDAVQVCLHVAEPPAGLPDYTLANQCDGNPAVISDRRLHRVYRSVFYVRNNSR